MFTVKQQSKLFRPIFLLAVFGLLIFETASAVSEQPVDYSAAKLEELVGPVALYPDDLIAIILPASSYPLQIVEAGRYLKEFEENPDLKVDDLKPDDDWDDAVVALLNYPEVIALLNEDLDWTWNLGEAVVNQQAAVLDAIQDFRGRAVAAGNLKTDDRQTVSQTDDVIEVTPVDPEVIYVPYYEPDLVVVNQRWPVYRYYPDAYPVYYYPYPSHYRFSSGFFWGVTTAYTIGWRTDRVQFHYYGQASHPYFGRHYTSQYYAPHAGRVRHRQDVRLRTGFDNNRRRHGNTWKPAERHGDRPRQRGAATNRDHIVASNFTGSTKRHNRAVDARVRSSATRDHDSTARRSWRRLADSARINTRAQTSQVHRPVQNTNRGARKPRSHSKPAPVAPKRSANVVHTKRSAASHERSRGHRSGKRGGHLR